MDRREQRRRGMARLVGLHDDDGAFDRAFWQTIPPHERLALVWELVLESDAWRGSDGSESRLQRSVCRLERRKS